MTPDELREAVARALCLQFYGTEWDVTSVFRRTICFDMADAALRAVREALREPTREMRMAFHAANEEYESGAVYPEPSPDYQWRAMLAASPLGGGDE